MRATRLLVVVLAGAILSGIAPVRAIETTSFGIDVVEVNEDRRLHIPIAAGETSRGELRVFNKQQEPITLSLSVVAARVNDSGGASLGGDAEPVGWVTVEPARVELAVGEERTIEVRVDAPRKLDGEVKTVAVLAQPAPDGGSESAPAVLQRLAITTYLEPDEDSLIASLGPFPWIAGAVLLVAAALLVRRFTARRSTEPT